MKKLFKSILAYFGYEVVHKTRLIDYCLYKYKSYSEYKKIQIKYNKLKLNNIWADKTTLKRVALEVQNSNQKVILGLCHGSRNGFEQNYLNSLSKKFKIIGTDISDTANKYFNSVQWDFHKVKKNWVNKFDFVYSNSLDQSWKPQQALCVWLNQIKRSGIVIIEHTDGHGPKNSNKIDPFGVRPNVMPYILTKWFGDQISLSHSVAKKKNKNLDAWLFVIKKNKNKVKIIKNNKLNPI